MPFKIIHVQGNQIYLHSMSTIPLFMTSSQNPTKEGVAESKYASSDALFTVGEPIISREIFDIVYDTPGADIGRTVPPSRST